MKKYILFLSVLVFIIAPVFGADLSDLLAGAKVNGNSFRSVENSYQSSLNTLKSKNAAFSMSAFVTTTQKITDIPLSVPDATFKATLPEYIDDMTIALGLTSKTVGDIYSLSPSVEIKKDFFLSGSEIDNPSDLAETLQVELNYQKGILQAENSFYDAVMSIMQSESQLKTSEKSLQRTKEDYQISVSSGQIQEGSVNDLKTQMQIESAQSALDSSKVQLQSLKNSFKSSFGIDFENVTEVPDYDLFFDSSIEMNTELYITYLKMIDAQQSYYKSIGKYSNMSVNGSVGGPITFMNGKYSNYGLTLSGGANYTVDKFNFAVNVGTQMVNKKLAEPTVTISGSWGTSDASSATDSNMKIQYLNAQSNYDNQLMSFNNSVMSMQSEIAAYKSEVAQFKIKKQYNQQILDYQTQLYELNYISQRDYQDAVDNVELDKINEIILAIKGLKLENQIKMLCL